MPIRHAVPRLFAAVLFAACGVVPSSSPDAGSAAPDAGTTPDAGSTGACNDVALGGQVIPKTTNAGPTPAMTGGTLVDGTYHLTRMDKYSGGVGSNTHQETWVYANGTVEVASTASDKPGIFRASGTFSTASGELVIDFTCPQVGTRAVAYTATPTQLVTRNQGDPNETHTFTRE